MMLITSRRPQNAGQAGRLDVGTAPGDARSST
jgi:hypothetical protein